MELTGGESSPVADALYLAPSQSFFTPIGSSIVFSRWYFRVNAGSARDPSPGFLESRFVPTA